MSNQRQVRAGALAVAVGAALVSAVGIPAPAHAAEGDTWTVGDRYYEVVFDRTIPAHENADWRASCPDSHPYLDAGVGTSELTSMGKGVEVHRSSWKVEAWQTGHQAWPDGTASASWGTARNWLVGDDAIRLTMVCTWTFANAWRP
ncbi:hypothetical protein [Agromyces silvae]|uniref:hypothetical protein n=1 Tax=Agromyces silvae TaxID=3388266 RepID=UPI00280BEF66|nr:hypothetical protein [Agromyces protaetiae]